MAFVAFLTQKITRQIETVLLSLDSQKSPNQIQLQVLRRLDCISRYNKPLISFGRSSLKICYLTFVGDFEKE